MKYWYKIVDLKDGQIKTLFHGLDGSKVMPVRKWLAAEKKVVSDGRGTIYISGWHVMPSPDLCREYLSRFTNIANKAIVRCRCRSLKPKSHSPSEVYLADHIFIEDVVYKMEDCYE